MNRQRRRSMVKSSSLSQLNKGVVHYSDNVSVDFDFRSMKKEFIQSGFLIPPNIDNMWKKIGCPIPFTAICHGFKEAKNETELLSIINSSNNTQAASNFFKFRSFFCYVLNTKNLLITLSQPHISLKYFMRSLSADSRILFSSVISILNFVLPKMSTLENKYVVLRQFAQWLIPKDVHQNHGKNELVKSILFLPINNKDTRLAWIILQKDKTLLLSTKQTLLSTIEFHDYSIDEQTQCLVIGNHEYKFISHEHMDFFKENMNTTDPFASLIRSFKYAIPYSSYLPSCITEILITLLESPDFLLVRTFFQMPLQAVTRDVCKHLHFCLLHAGMFSPFIRYIFDQDIINLPSSGTIFRGSTTATLTSSALLADYGSCLVQRTIDELISKMTSDPIIATEIVMDVFKAAPIAMRFLLCSAFRATIRRFNTELIPFIGIGSLIMLRCIIPKMTLNSNVSSLGKHIMNAFIFRKEDEDINDHELFEDILQFDVKVITLDDKSVPFQDPDYSIVFKFIGENCEEIITKYQSNSSQPEPNSHPLISSLVELIENCFPMDIY